MISILFICVLLAFASLIMTHYIRIAALRHNIIDTPNQRSSHAVPTPRGGGIAIVICWYVGILILYYLNLLELNLFMAFMSGLLLAVVSFIDDILTLPPYIRLVVQSITAIAAFYFLNGLEPVSLGNLKISSAIILYPVSVIGIIWFINLFNFLDGIDGYSSLEAIMIALVMFVLTGNYVCLVLLSSILGFLYWNWPKARIFMGDIGSTQLGFILVILGIYFHNSNQVSIIHWLMLSSLFWFDATLTLFRRWRNREVLSIAHRKHVYQRAVQSGLTHKQTIIISIIINLVIVSLVFLSDQYNSMMIPALIFNICFLYFITRIVDRKIPFPNDISR